MMLQPDVQACVDVTPAMHIPDHLNSTGTRVITRKHVLDFDLCHTLDAFSVFQKQTFELDKSSHWSAASILNAYRTLQRLQQLCDICTVHYYIFTPKKC